MQKSTPVMDASLKVTGRLKYTDDMKLPGMLYGKILHSPLPHARILSIDTSEAESIPGVRAVATYKDAPDVRYNANGEDASMFQVEKVLDDRVRYVGDKVAAVAADTQKIAEAAVRAIHVEYEKLPAYFDPVSAAAPDAYPIHECGNVMEEVDKRAGDIEAGMREADEVFEAEYEVPAIPHSPIEPHSCIADYTIDDHLTIYTASQDVFGQRANLARIFSLPMNAVRVICPAVGGAFGGKIDLLTEPVAALLSKKACRPVKITYTRAEELSSAMTRHAEVIKVRTGVRKDGTITAIDYLVYLNSGAYSAATMSVGWAAGGKFFKMLKCPNMHYHAVPVFTNRQTATAMRGFGSPQLFYVLNSEMNRIGDHMHLDMTDVLLRNLYDPNDVDLFGECLGNFRAKDCVRAGMKGFHYRERQKDCLAKSASSGRYAYGVGLAAAPHGSSLFGIMPDTCGVMLKMNEDGSLDLFTGVSDMGNGSNTLQRLIVSQLTGIPERKISVIHTDTGTTLFDVGAYASRGTYVGGGAAKAAGEKMRNAILREAAELLRPDGEAKSSRTDERAKSPNMDEAAEFNQIEETKPGCGMYAGIDLRDDGAFDSRTGKSVSMREIAAHAHEKERDIVVSDIFGTKAAPISAGVHFAQVRIDKVSGEVKVTDYFAAHDVGHPLNPMNLEGQLDGGIEMGIGYALSEGAYVDREGHTTERRFRDIGIPTVLDMPKIERTFLDSEEPTGPFGGKSIGECATVPSGAAVSNAVVHAVKNVSPSFDGFFRLPVRGEDILRVFRGRTEKD